MTSTPPIRFSCASTNTAQRRDLVLNGKVVRQFVPRFPTWQAQQSRPEQVPPTVRARLPPAPSSGPRAARRSLKAFMFERRGKRLALSSSRRLLGVGVEVQKMKRYFVNKTRAPLTPCIVFFSIPTRCELNCLQRNPFNYR